MSNGNFPDGVLILTVSPSMSRITAEYEIVGWAKMRMLGHHSVIIQGALPDTAAGMASVDPEQPDRARTILLTGTGRRCSLTFIDRPGGGHSEVYTITV